MPVEQGWVYVLVNSSMPGVVKVGRTARRPLDRAAELSGLTAVPVPFVVAYEQAFADCHEAERAIHARLDAAGLRLVGNREFFRGAASDIIRVVVEIATGEAGPAVPLPGETAAALMAAGDRALAGLGDALQDTAEAVRCYKLAAARGAPEAHQRLGRIYVALYAARGGSAHRRRALAQLKEGVRRGDVQCYGEMAELFALDGHAMNVAKLWSLYFRSGQPDGSARAAEACCRYIAHCLSLGTAPDHLPALRRGAGAMLEALLAEMDRVRGEPEARRRVAVVLRWVYAQLVDRPEPVRQGRALVFGRRRGASALAHAAG